MPRRRKKRSSLSAHERNQQHSLVKNIDFTVYDEKIIKPKKAWHSQVKHITGHSGVEPCEPAEEIADDWFEDCDQPLLNTKEPSCGASSSCRPQRKSLASVATHSSGSGHTYPVDLWFLIGDFVLPEDIAVFSRVCHSTHVVVHSVKFWLSIYRRFCRCSSLTLPPTLQPDSVEPRIHGLRTRVIRALFLAYPPLASRFSHRGNLPSTITAPVSPVDPEKLVGRRCVLAWYERPTSLQWRFFFRFELSRRTACQLTPSHSDHDALLAPDDVLHNADERSIILVAVTSNFVDLPVVMNQVLVKSSMSIDGMFARRLKLVFYSENVHVGKGNCAVPNGAVVADIDSLLGINILHWWDPSFPTKRL